MHDINYTSLDENKKIKKHYENFSVAFLLPKRIKNAITTVYAFARIGDDIADEPGLSKASRQRLIDEMSIEIKRIAKKQKPQKKLFKDIENVVIKFNLDINYFKDLLKAFDQDINKSSYKDESELFHYYKLAANSAGRLCLQINRCYDKEIITYSDQICSAFAMIDMIQDIQEDMKKNRVYLPKTLIRRYKIDLNKIKVDQFDDNWQEFKEYWTQKTKKKLIAGKSIIKHSSGRFNFEMRLLLAAGFYLNKKIKNADNPFKQTKMSKFDWVLVFFKGFLLR